MHSLILFDLDGTLVDPAGAITGGIGSALHVHGVPAAAAVVKSADELPAVLRGRL